MNLPNRLTTIRLFFVPLLVVVYLIPYEQFNIVVPTYELLSTHLTIIDIISFLLFFLASITDYLDGSLARKNNQVTTFGKFMDPIADKLIVNTAFLLLVSSNAI